LKKPKETAPEARPRCKEGRFRCGTPVFTELRT